MRVGLLSDTHIPVAPILYPEIKDALRGVDVILHAGDIVLSRVLDELEEIAPVYAAQGNHDGHLTEDPRVKPVHILELNGFTVALLHVFEPWDSGRVWLTRLLDGGWADVVISGDSHLEGMEVVEGTLCINAGSATMPRNRAPRPGHVGFLTLERGKPPFAELYYLPDLEHPILQLEGTLPTGENLQYVQRSAPA
jgi:putative phosphoesterase